MGKLKLTVMPIALAAVITLIGFSIYAAFLCPQRAQEFFNSIPLAIYWVSFLFLVASGFVIFRRLRHAPSLLLIHAGCIAILAGAIWGSQTAQKILAPQKIHEGQMVIYQGQTENRVILKSGQIRELPFTVKLKEFRVEYYHPAYLTVQNRQGQSQQISVEVGKEFPLTISPAKVTILRTFENFKITFENDKSIPIDSNQPGSNPALQVLIKDANGVETTQYIFELFGGYFNPENNLMLTYQRTIRDYISDLAIIEKGKVAAEKSIEVNLPLHFGGYHFYQYDYDAEGHEFTVLSVISDSGLNLVYAGYIMLCIGVFWHFWLSKTLRKKKKTDGN